MNEPGGKADGRAGIGAGIYYGYWLIAAAFVAQFVAVGVTNYAAGPFMLPMIEELGWSRSEYTIPRSLGLFVTAMLGFVIGTLVDRHGGRRFMVGGTFVCAVSLWMLGSIETLTAWIVLNGVLLTAGATMLGNLVVNVTLAKWFVERRGFAIAIAAMGVSSAGIVITPLITWVIEVWDWRFAWRALAVFSVFVGLPVSLMIRRMPEDHGLHPDGYTDAQVAAGRAAKASADFENSMTRREALRTSTFYMLIFAFGLFVINIMAVLLHGMPFVVDSGFTPEFAALMILITSVPAMLAKPIWGYFLDRLHAKPLGALGSAVTGLSLIIIVYAVSHHILWLIYAGFFLLGVGWGGMIPIQEVIWAGFFGRRYLGAVRSAAMPVSLLFGAGAPMAVAYYHDVFGSYVGGLYGIAAANLIAAVLILAIKPPAGRRVAAPVGVVHGSGPSG